MRGQALRERDDGLGDRDRVDGDVVEANDRHRLLFDAAQVGARELGGRDAGEQVRRLRPTKPSSMPAQARKGPSWRVRRARRRRRPVPRRFAVRAVAPAGRRVPPSRRTPRRARCCRDPAGGCGSSSRAESRRSRRNSERSVDVEVDRSRRAATATNASTIGASGDVEDIDVVTADQLEEQFHGAAEGRRRHDEGHAASTTGRQASRLLLVRIVQ